MVWYDPTSWSFNDPQQGNPSDLQNLANQGSAIGAGYIKPNKIPQNPYGGQWGALISQLRARANGQGPSLAQEAYAKGNADTTNNLGSIAQNSTNPGQAREAMMQQGRVGQGAAAGFATARNEEQMGAMSGLTQALGGASGNQQAYDQMIMDAQRANQNFLLGIKGQQVSMQGQPTEAQKWAGLLAQFGAAAAKAGSGGAGG